MYVDRDETGKIVSMYGTKQYEGQEWVDKSLLPTFE